MDALPTLSASELARGIRAGRFSAVEVAGACLERIGALNGRLNAVVQVSEEAVLAAAEAADAQRAAGGELGPLHGVPFTVKDWIETAGVICAAGLPQRAGFVPKADATAVARLRAAGAIFLGKTNVQESNPVYGATYNPYDMERSPGASSSGEAAALAAGLSPLGLGSDSGGSLRLPAHYCGVATIKPQTGRVPNTGHFPRISALLDPRTQIGPLARRVEDLALVLPLIAGVDWRDAGAAPVPLGDPGAVDVQGLRVAWFVDLAEASPDAETRRVMADVVAALRDAGMRLEEREPPRIGEAFAITQAYWARSHPAGWSEWEVEQETHLSGGQVDRSLFEWDRLRRAFLRFSEDTDVVVCPVAESPAPPHGTITKGTYRYTAPFSLAGWPVAVVRAGSDGGLPIGVQIAARAWRDDLALAVAAVVENALGGWRAPPL